MTRSILVVVVVLFTAAISEADLHDRGGGLIYDDVLDITWLQDTNYAYTSGYVDSISTTYGDGRMNWDQAVAWADQLVYGGYDDWRLPATVQPDPSGTVQLESGSQGYNCIASEMPYMFYLNLGGEAGSSIPSVHNANYDLFPGLEEWVDPTGGGFWSGTECTSCVIHNRYAAWDFYFSNGAQYPDDKAVNLFAWAVRDGDVTPVPLSASVLLGSIGLGLSGWLCRRRNGA